MENVSFTDMGNRICKRRTELRYTQKAFAEKTGLSPLKIRNIEQGKQPIRVEDLIRVCQVLNFSLEYLLTGRVGSREFLELMNGGAELTWEQHKLIRGIVGHLNEKRNGNTQDD